MRTGNIVYKLVSNFILYCSLFDNTRYFLLWGEDLGYCSYIILQIIGNELIVKGSNNIDGELFEESEFIELTNDIKDKLRR